jgi:hypothetical protein
VILDRPVFRRGEETEPQLVLVVPGWLVEVMVDFLVVRELDPPMEEVGDRGSVALVFSRELAQGVD